MWARSLIEMEHRSMASVCCEIIWLNCLLFDFGIKHETTTKFCCDNLFTIYICRNPIFLEHTKHIEMDCHFINEKVLEGLTEPIHVSTELQVVDILTKALQPKQYHW